MRRLGLVFAAIAALAAAACDEVAEEATPEDRVEAPRAARATDLSDAETWVVGNVVFLAYHEIGHALISEFELPVLGREEDAVDQFAAVLLAPTEEDDDPEATRSLMDAMNGWFLSSQQRELDELEWWDEHGPDQQRAFHVACLLYGSDPDTFTEVADEVELPEARRETCPDSYASAMSGWASLLEPHLLADDTEPTHPVRVVYGPAGDFAAERALLKRSAILESIAEDVSTSFDMPRAIRIEAKACGEDNAFWDPDEGAVEICYELLRSYAELKAAEEGE